jgi:hypothetical protein
MSQQDLLKRVVDALESSGCAYMVTGSYASSLQGEPRLTHDIDLVVSIPPTAVESFIGYFPPPEFHLDRDLMTAAIRERSMFSVIHVPEGDKIDFWMLTTDPFDTSRFARKIREQVLGMELVVSTPEDTILIKLRWSKLSGGSEKQYRDALRVYELQNELLDIGYIRDWARRLDVESDWDRIVREAEL